MLRVRCLGWTRKEASKEAKLHGRQCPLRASLRVSSFRGFHSTRPKSNGDHLSTALPDGKSSAPTHGDSAALIGTKVVYQNHERKSKGRALRRSRTPLPARRVRPPYTEGRVSLHEGFDLPTQNKTPLRRRLELWERGSGLGFRVAGYG